MSGVGGSLLTVGLVSMGVTAYRERGFGVSSFSAFAVVASCGWWIFEIQTPHSLFINDLLFRSALLLHMTLWIVLGIVRWVDPQEGADSIPET